MLKATSFVTLTGIERWKPQKDYTAQISYFSVDMVKHMT